MAATRYSNFLIYVHAVAMVPWTGCSGCLAFCAVTVPLTVSSSLLGNLFTYLSHRMPRQNESGFLAE
jgi:hypothetical protein